MKKINGFTMIELLVAATILALLTMISVVSFQQANVRARDGKRKADLEQTRAALELYRSGSAASYPSGSIFSYMIGTLKQSSYISDPVPVDPKNDSTYYYQYNSASGATYCMCATLEGGSGNKAAADCNGADGTAFYCLSNP
ncbi:MAG TPA: type II secretion system protein [Patescibacteria group bacterium]|nr:type II secretion system protein [Patescibacteria group bacterium]